MQKSKKIPQNYPKMRLSDDMSDDMLVSEIDIHDVVISYGLLGVSPERFELSTLGLKERPQPNIRYKSPN